MSLKTENSRRVAESRPVCMGLYDHMETTLKALLQLYDGARNGLPTELRSAQSLSVFKIKRFKLSHGNHVNRYSLSFCIFFYQFFSIKCNFVLMIPR
jgi:hypothetical protein